MAIIYSFPGQVGRGGVLTYDGELGLFVVRDARGAVASLAATWRKALMQASLHGVVAKDVEVSAWREIGGEAGGVVALMSDLRMEARAA